MPSRVTTVALLIFSAFSLSAGAATAEVPRVTSSESSEGVVRKELQPLYHAGGESDEENFFGMVSDAVTDGEGKVYLLDTQLGTIHVYGADGTFAGTLGREGEGPGEFRFPTGLARLSDHSLAVTSGMGGKIIVIKPDGTPGSSITPGDAAAGGFRTFFDIKARGEHLVLCGATMAFDEGVMKENRYLSAYDPASGAFGTVYWEKSGIRDMSKPKFIEKDEFFAADRYDIDDQGRLYVAEQRDAYSISVYAPDGTLERVIERSDYVARKRTEDDKADITSGMVIMTDDGPLEIENVVEDTDPAVSSLFIDDEGLLWVANGHADHHEGVFRRYDVFAAGGAWLREVDIVIPGDNAEDGLMPLGDGRFLHVIGLQSAGEAMQAGFGGRHGNAEEDEDLGEGDPLEVVCYRI